MNNKFLISIAFIFYMNSRRVYRDVCDEDYVFNELARGRGTQFDPVMVDALLRVMGHSADDLD